MAVPDSAPVAHAEGETHDREADLASRSSERGSGTGVSEAGSASGPSLGERLFVRFVNRGPRFWTAVTFGVALGLGTLDYFTGPELALSLVYALPVAAAAWFAGFRRASGVAVVSCTVWLAVEIAHGGDSRPLIAAFNMSRRIALLLGAAYLLAALKARLDKEARSARTDFLTGIGNVRSFYEDAAAELTRANRYGHPVTVVYADVDGFKTVNDQLGHDRGDAVLRRIATTFRRSLRSVDRVARMGGDEFALLLPETDLEAARATLEKLRRALRELSALEGRTVTMTMGAFVCANPSGDVAQLLALADKALLEGKRQGKDTVRYVVHEGPA